MATTIHVGDEVQVCVTRRAEKRLDGRRAAEGKRAAVTRGKVIAISREAGRVTVEGHNLRIKHLKRSARHPNGGRLEREHPIAIARVMLVAADGKPVRLADAVRLDGKIVRKEGTGKSGA
ncbi:MAG: 50S ribosomal protein L24 [Planctomycetes bacterium]|nr:50S ribosomal protein L24 [Planctomycetota bacterium]